MALTQIGSQWSNATMPQHMTILSDGTFLALSTRNGSKELWGQIYTPEGIVLGSAFVIKPATSGHVASYSAVALANGKFAVSWQRYPEGGVEGRSTLEGKIMNAGGAGGGIITTIDTNGSSGELAALAHGGYVIAYRNNKIVEINSAGVVTKQFDMGGNPSSYRVEGLSDGGYVSVARLWAADGVSTVIKADLHTAAGDTVALDVSGRTNFAEAEILTLANGNFAVVWREDVWSAETGEADVLKARFFTSAGVAVGGDVVLNNSLGGKDEIKVKALPQGGFVLSYVGYGADADVYVGTYANDGAVVNAPVVVGQSTAGQQHEAEINVLKDGRFVLGWSDTPTGKNFYQTFDPREGAVTVSGDGGNDRFLGTSNADTLKGYGGNDVLNGGLGADRMEGGTGNDIYYVDNAGDRVVETSTGGTADVVYTSITHTLASYVENLVATGSGTIRLYGNSLNNVITGNKGANVINGGSGNDKINGGLGKDVLYGSSGKDIFVFNTKPSSSNFDKIADYRVADDTIYLENAVFTKLKAGKLAASAFWKGAKAHDTSDRVIYDDKKGYLYYDADGTGSSKQVLIATMAKGLKMGYGEFIIT
ncbi:calcium-binding protein [Microvirga solisilvae]|uniref:calcium-binding protein n=1 Tax=Microvirga solisilvae TaxID=2919498 RepID=UPI001FAE9E94|nr:calcium-binding protein [Microvirga solisilvae]